MPDAVPSWPPRWLKPANKLMIAMQKLGIPTGPPGADWARNARTAGVGPSPGP
jgi:hypothetical protein